jgi:hypothetical protein
MLKGAGLNSILDLGLHLVVNPTIQSTKDVTKKSPSKIKSPRNFANKIKILTIFNAKTFL